jgi:SAM-dependent methyltransferase
VSLSQKKELHQLAQKQWAAGYFEAALHAAWAAYRLDSQDRNSKVLLARLIQRFPAAIDPDKRSDLVHLLQDRELEPECFSRAGWFLVLQDDLRQAAANNDILDTLAERLDADELSLALLREAPVSHLDAERVLTKVRRWLLCFGQWPRYRRLVDALTVQASLNGGAWSFDEAECGLLGRATGLPIAAAYLPVQVSTLMPSTGELADPVTRAVAEQYERWPWPIWRRVMAPQKMHLPDVIRPLDPEGPDCLPVEAKILIAGCGTGRQAVKRALEFPDAAITAIDVSEPSLHYARQQCANLNIQNIRFLNLDLHNISDLNEKFDAIWCSGVLHHLPDPERGWAALAAVLRPGGVMKIMVYSRIARLWVAAARMLIRDLALEPINDDLLRRVRQRLMDRSSSRIVQSIVTSSGFATLAGVHDLLIPRHEDPFDISRISRGLERLRLRLLSFLLPAPDVSARYHTMFPHDPMRRDMQSWAGFEKSYPFSFFGMYSFWCRSTDGPGLRSNRHVRYVAQGRGLDGLLKASYRDDTQ